MRRLSRFPFLVAAVCLGHGLGHVATSEAEAELLEEARMVFEQNATDEDVEVVFHIKGGDEGLRQLRIQTPDGKELLAFTCDESHSMGMRTFVLESPEPRDQAALRRAFPEGRYRFSAHSVSGVEYQGEANLEHQLPDVAGFVTPAEGAEGVSVDGLVIEWTAVAGVTAYLLEIEDEETGFTLTVRFPGHVTRFAVPNGLLAAETEYVLAIGTESASGNLSFVETSFETAE